MNSSTEIEIFFIVYSFHLLFDDNQEENAKYENRIIILSRMPLLVRKNHHFSKSEFNKCNWQKEMYIYIITWYLVSVALLAYK